MLDWAREKRTRQEDDTKGERRQNARKKKDKVEQDKESTRQRRKSRQSKTRDNKALRKEVKETDFKRTRLEKTKQKWETNKARENKGRQEIIQGTTSNFSVPFGPVKCERPEKNGVSGIQRWLFHCTGRRFTLANPHAPRLYQWLPAVHLPCSQYGFCR